MDYKKINEILSDLSGLRNRSKPVHREVVNEVNGDYSSQGEAGESYEVYDVGLNEGMFIKLKISTDSYGDNESIDGIEFVKAKQKTVQVYEF